MNSGRHAPIRTPPGRWWQEARTLYFPRLIFCSCVVGVALLWRSLTVVPVSHSPTVVRASVSGVLSEINVRAHQAVRAGDAVAAIEVRGGPAQTYVRVSANSDGVISVVYRHAGQTVQPGEAILAISPVEGTPGSTQSQHDAARKPVLAGVP